MSLKMSAGAAACGLCGDVWDADWDGGVDETHIVRGGQIARGAGYYGGGIRRAVWGGQRLNPRYGPTAGPGRSFVHVLDSYDSYTSYTSAIIHTHL
jgi:hypothetical protein